VRPFHPSDRDKLDGGHQPRPETQGSWTAAWRVTTIMLLEGVVLSPLLAPSSPFPHYSHTYLPVAPPLSTEFRGRPDGVRSGYGRRYRSTAPTLRVDTPPPSLGETIAPTLTRKLQSCAPPEPLAPAHLCLGLACSGHLPAHVLFIYCISLFHHYFFRGGNGG
jgi:hypothetical protein